MSGPRSVLQKIYSLLFLLALCTPLFGQSTPCSSQQPPPFSADRIRFQQQATFGYSPVLDNQIVSMGGVEQYLDYQLSLGSPTIPFPDTPLQPTIPRLECNGDNSVGPPDKPDNPADCFRNTYSMYPLQKWFFQEALYGDAQLRHRVAWALSQIWVTSALEIKQSRYMTEYYKILYKHALGDGNPATDDYFELMKEMTLNPAMGEYLDMAYSTNQSVNENYPRELLQLFTTGVNMLDQGGKEMKDANGRPIPVYDQPIVNNFAKVFTGWSFCNVTDSTGPCPNARLGAMNYIDPMRLNQAKHNETAKSLLSYPNAIHTTIPAGLDGNEELDRALKNIFNHPNVPPFVSKLLIQQLVTSNPSGDYVSRVAAKFIDNGEFISSRGDMRAVVRAILLDPEARGDIKAEPFGKLREPVQFSTNLLRAFCVQGSGTTQSDGVIFQEPNFLKMGQRPFYSPSVFNYYSPRNVISVDGADLLAPEFGQMTPTTSVARANFAFKVIFNGIGTSPDIPNGTALNFAELIGISESDTENGGVLVEVLNKRLMNGSMPAHMRDTILAAVRAIPVDDPSARVKTAVYLFITSAEFQIQR